MDAEKKKLALKSVTVYLLYGGSLYVAEMPREFYRLTLEAFDENCVELWRRSVIQRYLLANSCF